MDDQDILQFINDKILKQKICTYIPDDIKKYMHEFQQEGFYTFEKLYLFYFKIKIPKCANPECENKCKFNQWSKGYNKTCCRSCGQKNPETRNKINTTSIQRYGGIGTSSEKIKNKIKQTNLEKYGVDNPFKSDKVKDKIKQTNLERYGTENINSLSEVRDKIKKTNLEKYGATMPCLSGSEKYKKSMIKKYGVEHISQTDEFKKNMENKLDYEDIHNKMKKTNLERYGVEFYQNTDDFKKKIKNTMMERYGVEHMSQLESVKRLKESVFIKKYGVKYPAQVPSIHKKQLSGFGKTQTLKKLRDDLHYQNNAELNFINYCLNKNLNIKDGPSLEYKLDEKSHIYHVDFELDYFIVEIKQSHGWYKKDLASGKIEAKNKAAEEYSKSVGKEFLFLLDVEDYSTISNLH